MTYSFLRFLQLRGGGGGGAFRPGPRKQGYGYRIDLKFGTNNGTDNTSKLTKFKGISCCTFRDITSQKFPFQKGTSHRDSIFTLWNRGKLEKYHFLTLKTSFLAQNYTFHGSIQARQKNSYVQLFEMSHFKNNCSKPPPPPPPPPPPGESILLRFCQNVSNRSKLQVTKFGGAR